MVIARAADVFVFDRGRARGAFWRRLPIELVVEDGFDRAVGLGANGDGALRRGFDAFGAIGAGKTNDADANKLLTREYRAGWKLT